MNCFSKFCDADMEKIIEYQFNKRVQEQNELVLKNISEIYEDPIEKCHNWDTLFR